MAISVKDIQEKEFGTQATGGYNIEQVDDFLDEISEQMKVLVRENLELNKQIRTLEADVLAARKQAAEAEARTPDYNEKGYFQNLQNAMRESLIGAQRIADETTEEANRKAQEEADAIAAEAKSQVETLEARYESLKAAAAAYKEEFSRLLDTQANALRESNGLF